MRDSTEITPAVSREVHKVVAKIPHGKVAAYGQVAELSDIPGAAQEVGVIMSRVSSGQNLPCHRVVNKVGAMSPEYAFGGAERQRAMLEGEGVRFTSDGHIGMVRHTWSEFEQFSFL